MTANRLALSLITVALAACTHGIVVSPSPAPAPSAPPIVAPEPAPAPTPAPPAEPEAPVVITVPRDPSLAVVGDPSDGCIALVGHPGTWSIVVTDAGSEPLTLSATVAGPAAPGCPNIPDLPAPILLPPSDGPTSYAPYAGGTTTFTSPVTCGLYRVRIEAQRGDQRLPLTDVVVDTRRYCGR